MASRGRYNLVRKIADGGTAEVFLATMEGSAGFKRLVVLKRVLPKLWADEQFRRGLIDEAHIAMGLHHSNIVQVLDLGVAGQNYFLAFELVDGWTLSQVIKRALAVGEAVPLNLALHVMAEVCRGLSYAHTRSENGVPLAIVHRDVTPQNVLLSEQGEVKLTDFGIARARTRAATSQVGTVKGKPAYMSPEQTQGLALDARSDLFAIGTMLYQLTTGVLPFAAPTLPEQMKRVVKAQYEPPELKHEGLPREVSQLIAKALEREVDRRFQSAEEMLHAIERVQRTVLEPAGQTELKAWLARLSQRDHALPLSRAAQSQPPTVPLPQEASLPIELQDDDIVVTGSAAKRVPTRAGRWLFAAFGLAIAAAGITVWQLGAGPNDSLALTGSQEPTSGETSPVLANALDGAAALTGDLAASEPNRGELDAAVNDSALNVAPNDPDSVDLADAAVGAPVAEADDEPSATSEAARDTSDEPDGMVDAARVEADVGAVAQSAPQAGAAASGLTAAQDAGPDLAQKAAVETPRGPPKSAMTPSPSSPKSSTVVASADMVSVLFESEPVGASVRIDKTSFGKTPIPLRLKSGVAFDVVLTKPGFRETKVLYFVTRRPNQKVRVVLPAGR